jgi:hypothetical protein
MAWPPPVLPINRTNATPQLDTHAADHNAVNLAVNDLVARVQTIDAEQHAWAGVITVSTNADGVFVVDLAVIGGTHGYPRMRGGTAIGAQTDYPTTCVLDQGTPMGGASIAFQVRYPAAGPVVSSIVGVAVTLAYTY